MDNATIVLEERIRMMQEGKIGSTGRTIDIKTTDGSTKTIPEPEPLLTYDVWKQYGFVVKRGEHATAVIEIWMPKKNRSGKKKSEEKSDESSSSDDKTVISSEKQDFYKKKAFFFRMCQVEKQKAEEDKR